MKNNFFDKINNLTLSATILIASVILGGFFYASQVNKQHSIEQQQEIKLQDNRRVEETKAEQEQKEYVAKRRSECYEIGQKERENWNNVERHYYVEDKDICRIVYENPNYNEQICNERLKEIDSDLDVSSLVTECNSSFVKEY